MTIFVDQIINEVKVVPMKTIHKRQTGSMAVTEADHTASLERHNTGCQ